VRQMPGRIVGRTVDLDGNSAAWGTMRKYLRLLHVIKPDSRFEMFYGIEQPADTFTAVRDGDDFFRKIRESVIQPDDRIIIFAIRQAIPKIEKILAVKLEYF